jgi:hydrogenase expression/formation protein HypE
MMKTKKNFSMQCPIPIRDYPNILLAHGGGGKLMHDLIGRMFLPAFKNKFSGKQHDGAVVKIGRGRLAFTTDSYVVHPLFFPGGDIGSMAIYGTVNDLAMCGARPLYLSAAFIIEEGLSTQTLWEVVDRMRVAAKRARVELVTGDTKVVDRGKGDGIFINTAGVGVVEHPLDICPARVKPGDKIVLSGDLGRHGMAIMAVREGLTFESRIESDLAPLADLTLALLKKKIRIHCLRDLTRGGLASALNEIAEASGTGIHIEEAKIPVREDVRGACEILGFDPLYVANEGRFIALVPAKEAGRTLKILRAHPLGRGASVIGEVTRGDRGLVTIKTAIGTDRILDMLSGEQLPRIC